MTGVQTCALPILITELTAAGITSNAWGLWGGMLKYNLYGLFAMVTVIIVVAFDINIGPMRKKEMRVRKEGKVMANRLADFLRARPRPPDAHVYEGA